ncbi:MAG: penicillin-binding protein 2 [Candidatus Eisenbacteria bacterium]
MNERLDPRSRLRAWKLGLAACAAFLLLAGRLFQMQVVGSADYSVRAEENRIRPERIAALRGRIFDRNGSVLADSRPSFSVSVVPYLVRKNDEVLARLGELIGEDPEILRERARQGYSRPYEPRWVLRDVNIGTVSIVEEHRHELPGVLIESEPVRRYPQGSLAAHALGYLGELSREEAAAAAPGISAAGVHVGRAGIERKYEGLLRGRDGVRYVQEDARGRPLGTMRESGSVPGEDLWVALDGELQALAESLLAEYSAGSVVVLDPRSGEVLVLASWPSFDPNVFTVAVPPALWDSLSDHPFHPLLNRAIQATYPPGSTLKPVTAADGLMEGIVRPETRLLPCFGSWRFGRRVFGCWQENGHGTLSLRSALEQSCDVYFYQIGAKMDIDRFAAVAAEFGFGTVTGIDLSGERAGLIPTSRYMNDRYGRSGWGQGFLLNHAIGQGEILVTPLQLARFYGALATGFLAPPRLLFESVDAEGVATSHAPPVPRMIDVDREVLRPIREGIVLVVEGERGTGRSARVPGMTVAGKTGTAQNPHGDDHAWFAAWAPAENPRIVVAAVIENAGHGGEVAAPLVGDLLRFFFAREGA